MYEFNPKKSNAEKAEAIRRQYMEREITKMDTLQELHTKVKIPGIVVSVIVGVLGVLIMGTGMSSVMVWDNMTIGLVLGIPGMLMALLAYPIYKAITSRRKKKYASQILKLSGEIMGEKEEVK